MQSAGGHVYSQAVVIAIPNPHDQWYHDKHLQTKYSQSSTSSLGHTSGIQNLTIQLPTKYLHWMFLKYLKMKTSQTGLLIFSNIAFPHPISAAPVTQHYLQSPNWSTRWPGGKQYSIWIRMVLGEVRWESSETALTGSMNMSRYQTFCISVAWSAQWGQQHYKT